MNKPKIAIKIGKTQKWDDTYQLMSWWKTERVSEATIMVVGAGALGNEVLKNLALLNIGHILIVDFDNIEYSNLSRSVLYREKDCKSFNLKVDVAAERVREINPNVKVATINGDVTVDVGLGIFKHVDAVIGCLDNRLARLFLNQACFKVNRSWVDGGIENLAGQAEVFTPGVACYECTLTKVEKRMLEDRLSCPDIALRNLSRGRIPTTPITASIIAAMEVQEALKIVHEYHDKTIAGKRFYYEGMSNTALFLDTVDIKESCNSHVTYSPIVQDEQLNSDMTVAQVLAYLANRFSDPNARIALDGNHILSLEIVTMRSEKRHPLVMPKLKITNKIQAPFREVPNEEIIIHKEASVLDTDFPYPDKTFSDLGLPKWHIYKVIANDEVHYVEFSGDKGKIAFT